jgi:hypothetical protein
MRLIILLVTLGLSTNTLAQNNKELDERNGFKDIKLLSNVTENSTLEFWKDQKNKEEHSLYRPIKGSYETIGDVKIHNITIATYRNLIYEIVVITQKNEELFRGLEKAYGKIKYSVGSQVSYWESENVKLTYEPEGKSKVKLTYSAKGINQIIATDKKKAIEELSSEF